MQIRLVLGVVALSSLACAAGTPTTDEKGNVAQDVRGVYEITWSDSFTVRLDIGGAVQEQTVTGGEVVTFNGPDGAPLELDLAAWCADPAVMCPSEAWSSRIAIDQDNPTLVQSTHVIHAWDADVDSAVVNGWVDHNNDQFVLGLDGDSGGDDSCGALSLSLAGGTFYTPSGDTGADPYAEAMAGGVAFAEGATTGVVDGAVAVGWLGVCAWSGLVVAATLSVETDYTAIRTGDLPA